MQREFPLIRINVPSVDVFHDPDLSNFTLLNLKFKKITTSSSRLITQSEYRELDLLNFIFLYEKNLGNVTHSHKTLIRDTETNHRTWVDEAIVPGSLRIPTENDRNNTNSEVTSDQYDQGVNQGIKLDIPTYRKNGLYDDNLTKFEKIINDGKLLLTEIQHLEFEIQQISEIIESLKSYTPTNLQSIKDELVLTKDNLSSYFNNIKNPAGYTDALSNITLKIAFLDKLIEVENGENDFQTDLETQLDTNNTNLEIYISDFEMKNVDFQSLWRFNHVGSNSFVKGKLSEHTTTKITKRNIPFEAFTKNFLSLLRLLVSLRFTLGKYSSVESHMVKLEQLPSVVSIDNLTIIIDGNRKKNLGPTNVLYASILSDLKDNKLTNQYTNIPELYNWFFGEEVSTRYNSDYTTSPVYRWEAYIPNLKEPNLDRVKVKYENGHWVYSGDPLIPTTGVWSKLDIPTILQVLSRMIIGIAPIPVETEEFSPTSKFSGQYVPTDSDAPQALSELISEAYTDEKWESLKSQWNLEIINTLTNTLDDNNQANYELLYSESGGLNQQELASRGMLGRYDVINITPSARLRTYHSSLLVDLKPQSHTPDTVFGMGEYFERRKFQYKSGMYVWKDIVIESITSKKFGANIDSEVIQSPRHDSFHTNTYTFTSLFNPGTYFQQNPIDSFGYSIMAYRTETGVALTFSYNGGPATERMGSSDGMFLAGTWPPYNNLSHSTAFNESLEPAGTNAVEYKNYVFQFSLPDEVHHNIITQQADAFGDVLSVGHLNWSAGNGPEAADGRAQEVKVYFDLIYADSSIPTVTTELTEVPIDWAGTFDERHITEPNVSLEDRQWDWYYNPDDNCIYLAYETAYLLENRTVLSTDYDEGIEYTTNRHNVGAYYHGLVGSEYQPNVDMLGTTRNFDGWLYGKNNVYKAAADHLDTTGNSFNIRITLNPNLHYNADGNLVTELIGSDIELGADMTSWDTV